jgi:hypothetical protein
MRNETHGLVTPGAAEAAAVANMLERLGLEGTQAALGIGRHTIQRLRGRLPVRRGSLVVARLALGMSADGTVRP